MSDRNERRCEERQAIDAQLPVRRSFAPRWTAQMHDFSAHGCRVDTVERLQPGERMFVYLPGIETIESNARWIEGYSAGVEFTQPLHPAVFAMIGKRLTSPI